MVTAKPIPTHDSAVLLRCAVPAPFYALLDYLPPKNLNENMPLEPGVRISLPLGTRRVTGVLVEVASHSEVAVNKLKAAHAVLDEQPLIDSAGIELLKWVAQYYQHPVGETFALAMGPRERRGEPPMPFGDAGVRLNLRGQGLSENALGRAPKQAQLIAVLQDGAKTFDALADLGISRAVVREVLAKNLIERCDVSHSRPWHCEVPLTANPEQRAAIAAISESFGHFQSHLLEGVTGSGKTEVYLQLIANVVARGQQTLLLLPEIGLTPQMIARVQARFDVPIAVLHSGLTPTQRDRHWAMARAGTAGIILGTRSAVFAPAPNLALIIVDEEHDPSLSQQDGVRYSGRDVAVKRAQINNCPIVLGSATPSLESLSNANQGRYQLHRLTERAGGARHPEKTVIDTRGLALQGGLSSRLQDVIRETLAQDEQVLLFLNRRGFAQALTCTDCGHIAMCHHCDARMTLHRRPAELRCHHCNDRRHLPSACPSCASQRLVANGLGTEQTEQVLTQLFPNIPIIRADSDTMTARDAMAKLAQTLTNTNAAIVIGTQLLTKGHHFPKVTCVGVVDADSLLFNPDFRGEERLLQLLTQVSGRAGRENLTGHVYIQTRHPDHPLIAQLLERSYTELAQELLTDRQQRGLPPSGAIGVVRCDSKTPEQGQRFLEQLAEALQKPPARLIGPLPAPLSRRAGLFRSQLIIQAVNRRALAETASQLVAVAGKLKSPPGGRWFMDIDPVESF